MEVCVSCAPARELPCSPSAPSAPETSELLLPELKHKQQPLIQKWTLQNSTKKQNKSSQAEITFLEGFVDVDLTSHKVLVTLHVGKDTALVDPVVVMGAEKEDGEVSYVVAEALNVWRDQARIADLSWPPPK